MVGRHPVRILSAWSVRSSAVPTVSLLASFVLPLVSAGPPPPLPGANFAWTHPRLAIDLGAPEADPWAVISEVALGRDWGESSPRAAAGHDAECSSCVTGCRGEEEASPRSWRARSWIRMKAAAASTHEDLDTRSAMAA